MRDSRLYDIISAAASGQASVAYNLVQSVMAERVELIAKEASLTYEPNVEVSSTGE